ncbi:hypothetical protein ACFLZV_02045 [Candidatus Margulisiibacteriota bacterium]
MRPGKNKKGSPKKKFTGLNKDQKKKIQDNEKLRQELLKNKKNYLLAQKKKKQGAK